MAAWEEFRATVLAAGGSATRVAGVMRPVPGVPETGANDPLQVAWATRDPIQVAAVRERLAELERRRAAWRPPADPPPGEDMPF